MNFYRFDNCVLALGSRTLKRDGIELSLGARAFDLLSFLVANRHRVLTKAEILDAVWPEIAVEESNLTVQVSALRKVLGTKALVTIPGRGYQFVLTVEEETQTAAHKPTKAPDTGPKVLVLPFSNVSNDSDQEYFSDGIAEDIITDLSKVSTLSVVARSTSFSLKDQPVDVIKLGKNFCVTHIVEGSVRKSGTRLRINTQLVDATTGEPIWAERFDRELNDIFALQDEIARAVIAALKLKLLKSERRALAARPTDNPQAYELFLQARHYHLRADFRNTQVAIRLARQALDIDPNFDLAWALVAACQPFLSAVSRQEDDGLEAAERAIALNPDLPEAQAAKARVLAGLGKFDEALILHESSMQLDPDSYDVRIHFGHTLFLLGKYEEAIVHLLRAAEISEDSITVYSTLQMCYSATDQVDLAREAARRTLERVDRALSRDASDTSALTLKVLGHAFFGEAKEAKQVALRVKALDPESPGIDYNLACAMALLGEIDTALDFLESCFLRVDEARMAIWVKRDPDLDTLRDHPRFKELVASLESRAAKAKPA